MTGREISIAFQTDKTAAQYIELAKLVDTYAFDAISVYCDAPFHPSYGPLMLMAPHIRRARLGPAAVSPSRIHPIDIAAQTALLDNLAPGRTYIGLARGAWLAGHAISEMRPTLQTMREAVSVVRYLLTGQSGGYAGDVYQLAQHVRAPYPLPPTMPPILIGTWGPQLAGLAGEIADEVKIGGSANPDMVPVMRQHIAAGEARAGRTTGSAGVVMGAVTVVDHNREQSRARARREVALYLPVVASLDPTLAIEPDLIARLQSAVTAGDTDAAAALISDDLLERFAFAGSPDDIIRQAESLFAAGASRIEFGTPHGLDPATGINLIGQRVIPVLTGA
jgi:5,10-methylenetetrahydromethanopterin reductase